MKNVYLTIRSRWVASITLAVWSSLGCWPSSAVFAFDDTAASAEAPDPLSADYDAVLPILLLRCAVCHGQRRQEAERGHAAPDQRRQAREAGAARPRQLKQAAACRIAGIGARWHRIITHAFPLDERFFLDK